MLFGLCPASLFFRMGYSESVFLLSIALVMYGMAKQWPLLALAIIAGFSTAAPPVGVAVAASLLSHTIFNTNSGGIWRRVFQTLIVLPVSCWGLLAFMAYQYVEFGTAFAFAQTQSNWTAGSPTPIGAFAKYDMLAIGEPIPRPPPRRTPSRRPVRSHRWLGRRRSPAIPSLFFARPVSGSRPLTM